MSERILYTTEDGRSQTKLRADQQTVWLTQLDMAELFGASKQNISLHLKSIFQDGELGPAAVVKQSLTTAADGNSGEADGTSAQRCAAGPRAWPSGRIQREAAA